MQMEQERCNTTEGLFTTFNNKFKPQFNETIKSLQSFKLIRQTKENAEEWMGRLRLAAVEYNYREVDRQLKQQFIHGLNDNDMLTEIIRKLTKAVQSVDITSEQALGWARRVEFQRAQSAIMDSLTKTKEFVKIKIAKGGLKYNMKNLQTHAKVPAKKSCSYCSSVHPPIQCPAYGKKYVDCGKINHFRDIYRR